MKEDALDTSCLVDLVSSRLGGRVLAANDEFFAPKENLIQPKEAVFLPDEYTERGKWMDGWETRRRRSPGHDWAVLKLGLPGRVRILHVDTRHFKGNHPEACSAEVLSVGELTRLEDLTSSEAPWKPLLDRLPLSGDSAHSFPVDGAERATHLRLNIFPDGGIARLRAFGEVVPDWRELSTQGGELDLAAVENGGVVTSASDMFFSHRQNLNLPGPSRGMFDGWETRRRRGPGHDWVVVRLGRSGIVKRVEIDTSFFRGNAPASCLLEGRASRDGEEEAGGWVTLLPKTSLQADTRHTFRESLCSLPPVDEVRLNIFPDGGVARLRVWCSSAGMA